MAITLRRILICENKAAPLEMMNRQSDTTPLSRIGPKIPVDPNLPFHESLVHMFRHAVERKPDTVAVIYQDRSITYRDFGRATNGLARCSTHSGWSLAQSSS